LIEEEQEHEEGKEEEHTFDIIGKDGCGEDEIEDDA
jgi:hypothetical protein